MHDIDPVSMRSCGLININIRYRIELFSLYTVLQDNIITRHVNYLQIEDCRIEISERSNSLNPFKGAIATL